MQEQNGNRYGFGAGGGVLVARAVPGPISLETLWIWTGSRRKRSTSTFAGTIPLENVMNLKEFGRVLAVNEAQAPAQARFYWKT